MESQPKSLVIALNDEHDEHEEHSTGSDPKPVITMSNENISTEECSVQLCPPINIKQVEQFFRKRPVEEDCFEVNHKQMKKTDFQGECSTVGPVCLNHLTSNYCNKQKRFNYDSLDDTHINNYDDCNEKNQTESQKKILFSFCFQKCCEYCNQRKKYKKNKKDQKLSKQVRTEIIHHAKYKKSVNNINARKCTPKTHRKSSPKKPPGNLLKSYNSMPNYHKTTIKKCRMLLEMDCKKLNRKKVLNKLKYLSSTSSFLSFDEPVCIKFYNLEITNQKPFMHFCDTFKKESKLDDPFKSILDPTTSDYTPKDTCASDSSVINSQISSNIIQDYTIIDDFEELEDLLIADDKFQKISETSPETRTSETTETSIDILAEKKETFSYNSQQNTYMSTLEVTTSTNFYKEKETAIQNSEEKSNSSDNCLKTKYDELLKISMTLTDSEKKVLKTITYNNYYEDIKNWDTLEAFAKPLLNKLILYFGSYKMAVDMDSSSGLKNKKSDLLDIEMLLKSIKFDTSMLHQYYSFDDDNKNVLIVPLCEVIMNIVSDHSAVIILFNFVNNIITNLCTNVKEFLQKSAKTIVLDRESLFESLYDFSLTKFVLNTEASPKEVNTYNDEYSTDVLEKSNTENTELIDDTTDTAPFIKKNSSNEEICKRMVDILKSDDSNNQFWEECDNSHRLKSKLLEAGVRLPIEDSNIKDNSVLIRTYIKWFIEEYLQGDNLDKLGISILKNILFYIETKGKDANKKLVEVATNNALMILYCHPCFAKVYKSYLKVKYPDNWLSSEYINSSGDVNNSVQELLLNEPDFDFLMDPIDDNYQDSFLNSDMPLPNILNGLDSVQVHNLTEVPQSSNSNNGLSYSNLINEEIPSYNLSENITLADNCVPCEINNEYFDETKLITSIDTNFLLNNTGPAEYYKAEDPPDDLFANNLFESDLLCSSSSLNFEQTNNTDNVLVNTFENWEYDSSANNQTHSYVQNTMTEIDQSIWYDNVI